jgi:3-hydroxybutyrate dehydrogenase
MTELSGKHALVTGAGSGLGTAIALGLASAGAKVTISGRRQEALDEVARQSPLISTVLCDVTDPASVSSAFDWMREMNGPADIVVANAGAAESVPFHKLDYAAWRRMIDVNLDGVFLTLSAALSDMKEKGWGRLIPIASLAGLRGSAYTAAYSAAKHGVIGLTKSLALEIARSGITVNAICPGYTETPMLERTIANIQNKTGMSREDAENAILSGIPSGQFIKPVEVSEAVLWLCSPHSQSVNGQAIVLSGGIS